MVWENHSSTLGTLCLLGCLVGGSLYRQAPMRVVREPILPSPKFIPNPSVVVEMESAETKPDELLTLEAEEGSESGAQITERSRISSPFVVVVKPDDIDPKAL